MQLHNFFRSSTSHRLRIALNLKGIATDDVAVGLRTDQHLQPTFKAISPQGFVPALDTGERVLIQSRTQLGRSSQPSKQLACSSMRLSKRHQCSSLMQARPQYARTL